MSESERRKAIKDESMQADLQFGNQKLQKEAQDRRPGNFTGLGAQVRKSTE